ncbi:hypothetical protein GALMADRAFT_143475 [Galerina marginata CBS 339.88]|uniref:Uncharacterized protein n=1 Tax=Galerina marginata (strain CBS 339.88) TaxID=685588 RepID=A0A067SML8_GALM3|nr:hypothetical protein GALMADRAFT_143475 [Galerina marginata CBS 339.88]
MASASMQSMRVSGRYGSNMGGSSGLNSARRIPKLHHHPSTWIGTTIIDLRLASPARPAPQDLRNQLFNYKLLSSYDASLPLNSRVVGCGSTVWRGDKGEGHRGETLERETRPLVGGSTRRRPLFVSYAGIQPPASLPPDAASTLRLHARPRTIAKSSSTTVAGL